MESGKERCRKPRGYRIVWVFFGLAVAALFFFLGGMMADRPVESLPVEKPPVAGSFPVSVETPFPLPSPSELEAVAVLLEGCLPPGMVIFEREWDEVREGAVTWQRLTLKGRGEAILDFSGLAEFRTRLDRDYPGLIALWALAPRNQSCNLLLLAGERVVLTAELWLPASENRPVSSPQRPRLAVIIDDMGRGLGIARQLAALPLPLTFAVFPRLSHSRRVAAYLRSQQREIMLHLPMEPRGWPQVKPGPGALFLEMDKDQFVQVLEEDLQALPGIIGVNNHMGSRLTEDVAKMRILMAHLQGRGLFFIDSRTIADSVAWQVAREAGIPTLKRDVFLDNEANEKYILGQIRVLLEVASVRSYALGIGHPYPETVKALAKLPEMAEKAGVEIVPVRVLIRERAGPSSSLVNE